MKDTRLMPTKADPALIRSINADLVLRLIRDAGPISRAEIARRSCLSEPTVSDLVSSLVRRGLVREGEAGTSRGGRRPTMLRFIPDAALAIGVDIDGETIHVGLVNLAGTIIRHAHQPIRGREVDKLSRTISQTVKELVTPPIADRVTGIGIAVPGVVRPESHVVSQAPSLGWENAEIVDPMKAATGLPVCIENRANAAALGEFWRGVGEGRRDLVFITIRVGIGAGIVLNGRLYRGRSGAAGEIGYMVVDRSAAREEAGGFGPLEALASSWAMAERMRHGTPRKADRQRSLGKRWTPTAIIQAAAAGNRRAARVVRETVEVLGLGIVNLAAVLNPDLVIIGGSITEGDSRTLDRIRAIVRRLIPVPPQIVPSALGGKASLLGGAAQVFSDLYGLGVSFPSRLTLEEGDRGPAMPASGKLWARC